MRGIYLKTPSGLVEMIEEPYESESVLQENLAEHPKLLAGDQMDDSSPRRWLLIERETGIPDREDGNERWAADHLFVDQDGIPTIVEVKRSLDTRIRRKVVGQMLDYAAHATSYWRDGRIQRQFVTTCDESDRDPDAVLDEWLGPETTDGFWNTVENNLRAGRMRMLFVADEIPRELKRIVEFLNEQMTTAEVLAVEVKQFSGEDQTALVPNLIGQTEQARETKSKSTSRNYHDLLMEFRARIVEEIGENYLGYSTIELMANTATKQLEFRLPVSEVITNLLIWEIEPHIVAGDRIDLRLRTYGIKDGQQGVIDEALVEFESELEAREFDLNTAGAIVLSKSGSVPRGGEELTNEIKDQVVDDFAWFATEIYPRLGLNQDDEPIR